MEEQQQLFRKESMERISSPEQLQDYLRVTSPGIWMILAAVVCLLAGLLVCASVGRLETSVPAHATVKDGMITVVSEETAAVAADEGAFVRVAGQEIPVVRVSSDGQGRLMATAAAELPDGEYDAELVTETVSPISFLLN